MIPTDPIIDDDVQIVNGTFQIPDQTDNDAFFNLIPNPQEKRKQNSVNSSNIANPSAFHYTGTSKSNQFTPSPAAVSQGAPSSCAGQCNSCVWSFLCNAATKGMSSPAGTPFKLN